ncbi:MAG TPA: DUF3786 domain-containing protein [Dehalococcoidia bacterium]|nr:DUF3786 domain-containing protein [Dehalococcoidia bacterium]
MARERLTIPNQNVRDYAHELAYTLARQQLAAIKDIQKQCRNSGTEYIEAEKVISIDFLNQSYKISYPDGEVFYKDSEETVPIKDKILIMDYFTRASGTPLTGKLITYKELHDGLNYFDVFHKRGIQPFVTFFGEKPDELVRTAGIFNGKPADYGDVAVTINAFSRVPVTIALWRGDEEFGPEGSILFDSTVSEYLTNDDIHALCEGMAWKMVRALKDRR